MTDQYSRTVNFAGGGSGGGSLIVATRTDNNNPAIFADFAALETYTATPDGTTDANRINVSDQNEAEEVFGVGTLNSGNQVTSITAAYIRLNGAWVSVATNLVGTPGQDGQDGQDGQADLSGVSDQRVPFNNGGTLADSPMRIMPNGDSFIQGVTNIEAGTLALGPFIQVSERGGFIGLTNAFGDEFTLVDYRTPRDAASTTPRILEYTEAENNFDIQTVQTEQLTSPIIFTYTPTMLARTNALIGQVGADVTNLRFRIANSADTTQVLKFWPSEAAWLDDTGEDFSAGEMTLDFEDTELPLNSNTTLNIEIRFDSGNLLGDTNGVPALTAVLQRGQFTPLGLSREDVDSITAEINGQDLTLTLSRGEGVADLMTTVTLPQGGGTIPPDPGSTAASISRFEIANQPTSVLAGTELSGTKTFDFNVNHPEDVNGNLRLLQGTTELRNDIDPSTNSFTQTINTVTLQNNQQAIFRLTGTTNEGVLLDSFYRIRAHLPPEQLFFGQSSSNNPADVDTATLSHIEAGIDNSNIQTGDTTQGNYFIVLTPNDHDISLIIDALGQNVTDIFTRTPDVRTLNGVLYTSYAFGPVNAGASESYTLRF